MGKTGRLSLCFAFVLIFKTVILIKSKRKYIYFKYSKKKEYFTGSAKGKINVWQGNSSIKEIQAHNN